MLFSVVTTLAIVLCVLWTRIPQGTLIGQARADVPQWEVNPWDCNIAFENRWDHDMCWAAATGEDWRCGADMSGRNLYLCRAMADSARRARFAERETRDLRREVRELRESKK